MIGRKALRPTAPASEPALHIRQGKTAARVRLPVVIVPRLVARIEAERARQEAAGLVGLDALILNPATGRPYADKTFDRDFASVREAAAADMPTVPMAHDPTERAPFGDLWFSRLRHTAIVRLADASCTHMEIASISGHKLATVAKILEGHYWVATPEQAENAFRKRLEKEAE